MLSSSKYTLKPPFLFAYFFIYFNHVIILSKYKIKLLNTFHIKHQIRSNSKIITLNCAAHSCVKQFSYKLICAGVHITLYIMEKDCNRTWKQSHWKFDTSLLPCALRHPLFLSLFILLTSHYLYVGCIICKTTFNEYFILYNCLTYFINNC